MAPAKWQKGYVQVYTGNGKGKTTAALGLALRAAGAELDVFFAQFIKKHDYHEVRALERYADRITIRQYGRGCFIRGRPDEEDIAAARCGLEEVRKVIREGAHQLVVLDEANVAVNYGLFLVEELLSLIEEKPAHVELVFTGRNAAPELVDRADLVTEMSDVKHYYRDGVEARAGIEG